MPYTAYNATIHGNGTIVGLFQYVNNVSDGYFISLFLLSFNLIVMFSIYFGEKRTTGTANFSSAFAVSSILTFIIATMLTLTTGLVNATQLGICFVVVVIAMIVLFMTRDRWEGF